jgi:hypothetical protein
MGSVGGTPEYNTYIRAKCRCTNPKNQDYSNYGAKGIKFLFKSFEEFFDELGKRPKNYTIERINNLGNYEPGNVKWASRKDQANNRSKPKPITHCRKGHLLTKATTYIIPSTNARQCIICKRQNGRDWRKRTGKTSTYYYNLT